MRYIKIEQIGSPIRRRGSARAKRDIAHGQRATLLGLKLNKIGRTSMVPDTPAIRGMIAKVKHLVKVHPSLLVTFDSNAYRQVVDPDRSHRDASVTDLRKINAALKEGRILGHLSETVVTLEGIQNPQRANYFAGVQPHMRRARARMPDGDVRLGMLVEADDSLHPGLHPIADKWIRAAKLLGLKFLRAPRIGAPRPAILSKDSYVIEPTVNDSRIRQERFFEALRAIEARGAGMAKIQALGERIKARERLRGPWYQALNQPKDAAERREIEKAVREWADGDTVAAHTGYNIDVLCTADKGGELIFNEENRAWLKQRYGIRIVTLSELAAELCCGRH